MKSNNTTATDHCCHICNKSFTLKRNVTKHLKVVHNQIQKLDDKNGLHCPLDCKPRFVTRKYVLLRNHVSSRHGVTIECEEKTFSSPEEFSSWKHCIEKQLVCSYVALTAPKRLSFGQKKTYYVCHRSGLARQTNAGKRTVKFQGSCKVGTHCPSTLELTEDEGKFQVKFYKTHVGHNLELAHIKLTREERTDLAGKILNGESFTKIINDVQGELADEETLSRRHVLTRRDLHNIKFELRSCARSAMANQTTGSSDEVKRKLNLLLGLMDDVEMDEASYATLEQVLDGFIQFAVQKGVETNAVESTQSPSEVVGDTSLDALLYAENDLSHVVDILCDPEQINVSGVDVVASQAPGNVPINTAVSSGEDVGALDPDLFGCAIEGLEGFTLVPYEGGGVCIAQTPDDKMPGDKVPGDKAPGDGATQDLHLNVIQYARRRPKPLRRILPKTEPSGSGHVSDLHLDVIRCTRDDEPRSFSREETSTRTGEINRNVFPHRYRAVSPPENRPTTREDVATLPAESAGPSYLDVIECGSDDVASPNAGGPEVSCVEGDTKVFRCARRKQENVITLRKRLRGDSASSIRVYAMNDRPDGSMLDTMDFDHVYGIEI